MTCHRYHGTRHFANDLLGALAERGNELACHGRVEAQRNLVAFFRYIDERCDCIGDDRGIVICQQIPVSESVTSFDTLFR